LRWEYLRWAYFRSAWLRWPRAFGRQHRVRQPEKPLRPPPTISCASPHRAVQRRAGISAQLDDWGDIREMMASLL